MKNHFISILVFGIIGISLSCSKDEIPPPALAKFIYTNSFESLAGIEEFSHTEFCWLSDTILGAFGQHSVVFGGGCFYGHFNKTFPALDHDAFINILVIANAPINSHHTDLYIDSLHYSLGSRKQGWQTIQFNEDLFLPANTPFTFSMTNQSGTFVDFLQVYEK